MAGRFTQLAIVLIYWEISLLDTACVNNCSTYKDINHYQDGDIILRKGRSVISGIISASIKTHYPIRIVELLLRKSNSGK